MIAAIGCGTTNRFVYVVGRGTNSVFGFLQRPAGTLVPLSSAFSTDSVPVSVISHPSGKFVYVANFAAGNVTLFSTSSNGNLNVPKDPISNNVLGPFNAGTNPIALGVTSDGKFLYVLNQGSSNIAAFSIDGGTGNLTVVSGSPFATVAAPQSIAVAANNKVLYVANPAAGTVSGFAISSSGALSAISGSPFAAGTSPSFVIVDHQSKLLYVADSSKNAVLGFSLDANGVPSSISGSPFAAGTNPVPIAIDSNSSLLAVANQGSNNVSVYSVSS